jgi:hypothetical protein
MFLGYGQTRSPLVLGAAICSGLFCSSFGQPAPAESQTPDPATQLCVSNFHAGWYIAGQGRSSRQTFAIVDIVDGNGSPVNGVLVKGNWSGCYKLNGASDTTETVCTTPSGTPIECVDGRAVIWGKKHNCPNNNCLFTFTITSVQKDGMTYVPAEGKTSSSTPCNALLGRASRRTPAAFASSRQVVSRSQPMPTRRFARWWRR